MLWMLLLSSNLFCAVKWGKINTAFDWNTSNDENEYNGPMRCNVIKGVWREWANFWTANENWDHSIGTHCKQSANVAIPNEQQRNTNISLFSYHRRFYCLPDLRSHFFICHSFFSLWTSKWRERKNIAVEGKPANAKCIVSFRLLVLRNSHKIYNI